MKYIELRNKLLKFNILGSPTYTNDSVTVEEIKEAENDCRRTFDECLKEYWLDVGYGFIKRRYPLRNAGEVINDVLGFSHPLDIATMINDDPERFADNYPFFDCSDDIWLIVRKDGLIAFDFDQEVIVANTVEDFIAKIFSDARYLVGIDHNKNRIRNP